MDKAIKYIEDRFYIDEETGEYYLTATFSKDNVKELLEILKREINNVKDKIKY